MIFRSNLTAPDLSDRFKLLNPPMTHMGHDAPSDPDYEPNCSYWTHDEAAILYHCAARVGGIWLDIGSRLGWTAAHILAGGAEQVWAIDPEYTRWEFTARALDQCQEMIPVAKTSAEFLAKPQMHFDAAVVDGCHDSPEPSLDGVAAASCGARVILFHDFQGMPVRDAVRDLLAHGWKVRIYDTPNGVAVCWLDDAFVPPVHVPDAGIDWAEIRARYADFDFGRCV